LKDSERIKGLLLGVAFGDAYAFGWEPDWPPPMDDWVADATALRTIDVCGAACYSDDTEMTLILAHHLASNCGVVRDRLASDLAAKASLGSFRGYGITTTKVLSAIRRGKHWEEASRRVNSYGNGAAIRVAPVAAFFDDEESVARAADYQAMITHYHSLGREGAVLIALAQYLTISGVEPDDLVSELLRLREWSSEYGKRLSMVHELLEASPPKVRELLGSDSRAHKSVVTAIYCYVRAHGSPLGTVLNAISLGGDTDSVASMAASLAGAYQGPSAFPSDLVVRLENLESILGAAEELLRAREMCATKVLK